jgi:hypothetical protein
LVEWLTARSLTGSLDPVGPDDQPALLYYAFGIDDFSNAAAITASISEMEMGNALTYTRRLGLDGIDWVLESSSDLKEWLPETAEPQVIGSSPGMERASISLPGESAYWRLRVSVR